MNRKNAKFSFVGALIFFFTVALAVTVSLLAYGYVDRKTEGDRATIAVVMLLIVLFLTVLFNLIDVIRRRIMVDRPVEKILLATEQIAQGDFSVRIDYTPSHGAQDPYEAIMDNINLLAEELHKSETLKSDFIANLSHELKTPLSVIQNYAKALQCKGLDSETQDKYLQTIFSASAKLTALVTNILKLNKLENSPLLPEKTRFRLDEQWAEVLIQAETLIEKKEITLTCDMAEVTIQSYPALLEIVWNNLLSNAVKFTQAKGEIDVRVAQRNDCALVSVRDNGCGISPAIGKRIFDKFYQGDTSHAAEGNGLGLALVKQVIDKVGGEISVQSREGEGSTFTVLLKGVCDGE